MWNVVWVLIWIVSSVIAFFVGTWLSYRRNEITEFNVIRQDIFRVKAGNKTLLGYLAGNYTNEDEARKFITSAFSVARTLPFQITNLVEPLCVPFTEWDLGMCDKHRVGMYLLMLSMEIEQKLENILKDLRYRRVKRTPSYLEWELGWYRSVSFCEKEAKEIFKSNYELFHRMKVNEMVHGKPPVKEFPLRMPMPVELKRRFDPNEL